MIPIYEFTRDDMIAAFECWNAEAEEENWEWRDDPEASADYLIQVLADVQA